MPPCLANHLNTSRRELLVGRRELLQGLLSLCLIGELQLNVHWKTLLKMASLRERRR
jgi:hypothetical protein